VPEDLVLLQNFKLVVENKKENTKYYESTMGKQCNDNIPSIVGVL